MLVQDGPSEVTTAVKACGRERIQQLRAITLQKKKSPSFSMLRLCLLKVRKIYCSSAVNLGMIFFSRLTFLSKVNNQTYGFSINIDTGGVRFPFYARKVIVCEALWPEIGYIFWPFWQACNRAYFTLWIGIGYDCVKMKLIFPWLIGRFPDELKKFLVVCVNGGQETFRRSPLKFWGFSPLEQKTRRFDLFTQTWIHVRSRSWKKINWYVDNHGLVWWLLNQK